MSEASKFANIAMKIAIADSALKPDDYEVNQRCVAILGSGIANFPDIYETVEAVKSGNKR